MIWSAALLLGCGALGTRLALFTDWNALSTSEIRRGQGEARLEHAWTLSNRAPLLRAARQNLGRNLWEENLTYIAPADTAFQWASAYVLRQATRADLEISVLTPLSIRVAPWEGLTADTHLLKLFAVRLDVLATYTQVVSLVRLMEQDNPLLTLTSMSVIDTARDAGRSRVTMVWEWPMWRELPESASLQALVRAAR